MSAFVQTFESPWYILFFISLVTLLLFALCLFLPDSLETNEFATLRDANEIEFILAYKLAHPEEDIDELTFKLSFRDHCRIKAKSILKGLSEPLVFRFYAFLLLSGLVPSFGDFFYYF